MCWEVSMHAVTQDFPKENRTIQNNEGRREAANETENQTKSPQTCVNKWRSSLHSKGCWFVVLDYRVKQEPERFCPYSALYGTSLFKEWLEAERRSSDQELVCNYQSWSAL